MFQTTTSDEVSFDLVLNLKKFDAKSIIDNLPAITMLPQQEDSLLTIEDPKYPSPETLLRILELPGYNEATWRRLSDAYYQQTDAFKATSNLHWSVIVLRRALSSMPKLNSGSLLDVLFIGDFHEIQPMASLIAKSEIAQAELYLDWHAFCPDPYSDEPNQFYLFSKRDANKTTLKEIYPFYEQQVGRSWLAGADGSGLLNETNLLQMTTMRKSYLVITAVKRMSPHDLPVLLRTVLAVFSTCEIGGTAVIRFVIPQTAGVWGLLAFIDLFFTNTRLIRLKQTSPDDNTIHVIGTGFIGLSATLLKMLIEMACAAVGPLGRASNLLLYLNQNSNKQQEEDVARVYIQPLRQFLSGAATRWERRNL